MLEDLVKANETNLPHDFKEQTKLHKKPSRLAQKRGGAAKIRVLSVRLASVLLAPNRGGVALYHTLERANTQGITEPLRYRLWPESMLVSDANPCYATVARELGVKHVMLNQLAGEHVRGAFQIQTVNIQHSGGKCFLKSFNRVVHQVIWTATCAGIIRLTSKTAAIALKPACKRLQNASHDH